MKRDDHDLSSDLYNKLRLNRFWLAEHSLNVKYFWFILLSFYEILSSRNVYINISTMLIWNILEQHSNNITIITPVVFRKLQDSYSFKYYILSILEPVKYVQTF